LLELRCNCGWTTRAENRDELLEEAKAHIGVLHPDEPRDETTLRAMIAQNVRVVDERRGSQP
jgi:predicted small metal-binding protein